jgi:hypothetical protein
MRIGRIEGRKLFILAVPVLSAYDEAVRKALAA